MIIFKKRKNRQKLERSLAMREAQELDYNKDGSVQINVGLKDVDDFYYPFSYKTYELTNPEVTNYINMCEEGIPYNVPISIDIYTETPTDNDEKKIIKQSIKRYYAEKIVQLKNRQKRNLILGIFYIIVGTLLLLLDSIFYTTFKQYYIDFLIEVIGWVFLWDGVETIMGEWSEIGREKKQSYHLLNAKIHVRQYSKKIQREYGIGEYDEDNDE